MITPSSYLERLLFFDATEKPLEAGRRVGIILLLLPHAKLTPLGKTPIGSPLFQNCSMFKWLGNARICI
jgi:hypothetical protein